MNYDINTNTINNGTTAYAPNSDAYNNPALKPNVPASNVPVNPPSSTFDASALSQGTPNLNLPTTPTPTDHSSTITSIPSLSDITAPPAETPAETKQKSLGDRLDALMSKLGGKGQAQADANTANGVTDYTKQLTDLDSQITTLKNKASAIVPSVESQYRGNATTGFMSATEQEQSRQNAIQALTLNSLSSTLQGKLTTAKAAADQAVAIQFDPIQAEIDATKQALTNNLPFFNKEEQQQATAQKAQLDERQRLLDQQKEDAKTILGWANTASLNGAPNLVAQQIAKLATSDNPDLNSAFALYSQYSKDPQAEAKAIADLAQTRAQTQASLASAANSNASAEKTRVETQKLNNPVITNPDGSTTQNYSTIDISRYGRAANSIVKNFIALPQYSLTANGLPYLQRIQAADTQPGSVSDADLLDSIVKLNSGGGQVTEAQVKLITDGKSYSDALNTWKNKLGNGGILSDTQREQLTSLANKVFDKYKTDYQPVYDQATKQLKDAGIPEAFWTIPNLNKLSSQNSSVGGTTPGNTVMTGPDGKQYNVPNDKVDAFTKAGGKK